MRCGLQDGLRVVRFGMRPFKSMSAAGGSTSLTAGYSSVRSCSYRALRAGSGESKACAEHLCLRELWSLAMGATKAQLKTQFERAKRLGWLPHFEEAAAKYGFEPAFLLAIGSRETNLDPKWLRNAGDGGRGFGLMQVDVGTDIDWIKTGKWKDAREGILRGALVLSQKRTQLKGYKPGTPVKARDSQSKRWYSTPAVAIKKGDYEKVLAGMYNGGSWPVYHYSKGRGSDYGTTGKDYGADVVARAAVFAQLLAQDAPRAAAQAEDESPETTMPANDVEQEEAPVPVADATPAPAHEGEPAPTEPAREDEAIVGGRPSDPPVEVKAGGIFEQFQTKVKAWWVGGTTGAATFGAAVWGWLTKADHLLVVGLVIALAIVGTALAIGILWLKNKREERAQELAKLQLQIAADPTKYNAVVVSNR
jgi:hypothetical protein